MNTSQLLGVLGTGLVIIAYVPQISHLLKEHCSAGISIRAYILWFFSSLLFLVHAIMIRDAVFITVQIVNLAAIVVIVIFAKRFEQQMCETHLAIHLKPHHHADAE